MKLNEEQLAMLEKLGSSFFSVSEAAIVLEVSEMELARDMKDRTSDAYKRYHKGLLGSELQVRESIIKMATRGSNPAQKMLLDILQKTRVANL